MTGPEIILGVLAGAVIGAGITAARQALVRRFTRPPSEPDPRRTPWFPNDQQSGPVYWRRGRGVRR